MCADIIQWNCRGIKPNFEEIELLINDFNPTLLCFQETFLKSTDDISFNNFCLKNYICNSNGKASGGVSILVKNSVPHSFITLQTSLQAIAISFTMHK
uniref:endonuclease/exonuclease/phosphatase family protein n=1 Tax=Salmonella sp. s55004 TaxID=3159675 RepID=UPI003980AFAE